MRRSILLVKAILPDEGFPFGSMDVEVTGRDVYIFLEVTRQLVVAFDGITIQRMTKLG